MINYTIRGIPCHERGRKKVVVNPQTDNPINTVCI